MEVQVKQEDTDSEGDRLPTICDVFSIKHEESSIENVLVDGGYQSTHSVVFKYEEIKIEPFDVLSIKREDSPTEDIPVDTNNQGPQTNVEYQEIKIEEFDVDKALLKRERVVSPQRVGTGQVMSRYLTFICY